MPRRICKGRASQFVAVPPSPEKVQGSDSRGESCVKGYVGVELAAKPLLQRARPVTSGSDSRSNVTGHCAAFRRRALESAKSSHHCSPAAQTR